MLLFAVPQRTVPVMKMTRPAMYAGLLPITCAISAKIGWVIAVANRNTEPILRLSEKDAFSSLASDWICVGDGFTTGRGNLQEGQRRCKSHRMTGQEKPYSSQAVCSACEYG